MTKMCFESVCTGDTARWAGAGDKGGGRGDHGMTLGRFGPAVSEKVSKAQKNEKKM